VVSPAVCVLHPGGRERIHGGASLRRGNRVSFPHREERITKRFFQKLSSYFKGWRVYVGFDVHYPDPDPGGQKWPTKKRKCEEISCLKFRRFRCEGWNYTVQTLNLILPCIQRIPQLHFRIESKFLLRLLLCMSPNFTLSFHYPDLGGASVRIQREHKLKY